MYEDADGADGAAVKQVMRFSDHRHLDPKAAKAFLISLAISIFVGVSDAHPLG
jgi:hypothetical protein